MNSESNESQVETSIDIQQNMEPSTEYIGRWDRLISTTNWDKGEIICAWRDAMMSEGGAASTYSDETWSRMVGGISPQHVGRLRRTHERFGATFADYPGLFWSHFYAALDWEDAEMYLEGAVQSQWSVSQMRTQRWEAMGGDPNQKPRAADIVTAEVAEELQTLAVTENIERRKPEFEADYVPGPRDEDPDFGNEPSSATSDINEPPAIREPRGPAVKLFADFDDLPEDLDAAAENFKLAIIRHKADQWSNISRDKVLALLDALKQLAMNESE
jgi:hypothetical protein